LRTSNKDLQQTFLIPGHLNNGNDLCLTGTTMNPLQQMKATEEFTQHWSPEERESVLLDLSDNEPLLQTGRGEKRSFEDEYS
jgi:hypothetical protein